MAEIVAAGTIHPHGKRLALSACSHNEYGQPYAVTSAMAANNATGPSVGVVVKQMPRLVIPDSTVNISAADLGCYLSRVGGAPVNWNLPTAASVILYFGLKEGDMIETPYTNGTAVVTVVPGSGFSFDTGSPTTLAATKCGYIRIYIDSYAGAPDGAGTALISIV